MPAVPINQPVNSEPPFVSAATQLKAATAIPAKYAEAHATIGVSQIAQRQAATAAAAAGKPPVQQAAAAKAAGTATVKAVAEGKPAEVAIAEGLAAGEQAAGEQAAGHPFGLTKNKLIIGGVAVAAVIGLIMYLKFKKK
jgi:hypothetical protein